MYHYPRLRDLREDHDLTLADVAKLLKTTQQQYFKYQKGLQEIPVHQLIKLSKLYKVSIDYILSISNNL